MQHFRFQIQNCWRDLPAHAGDTSKACSQLAETTLADMDQSQD